MYKKSIFAELFLSLCLTIAASSICAQTASVFIDVANFDGIVGDPNFFNNANYCTSATLADVQPEDMDGFYACAITTGLTGGPYMFQDPVPAGNIITDIEVILYNDDCSSNNTIDIADAMLMVMSTGSCFSPVECGVAQVSVTQAVTPADMATYNFGGMNQFEVMSDGSGADGATCFTHAEIIFTYVNAAAIPTLSQWGLIMLALLMTSLAVLFLRARSSERVVGVMQ